TVEFDDNHVIDSDAVLRLQRVPGSLVVVGAGVIGIEYASMFAALGTRVTVASLASGKRVAADMVMYSAGRQGVTDDLDLEKAGLAADKRGRIEVDGEYRTSVPHIFAVGDVIGFPALAATSMDQGRLAACHAFGEPVRELRELQPIGIYTVPEISFCGLTEAELTRDAVPYEVGMSRYRELARGAIVGDSYGMLKLLVHSEERTLLGVHV